MSIATPTAPIKSDFPKVTDPQLWQTLQVIANPLSYLEKNRRKFGDVFALSFNAVPPLVVLSDPQMVKELFAADTKRFKSGESNRQFMASLLGDYSMIMLDGVEHQRQRRLLTPPLQGDRMRAYGQLMCDITRQAIASWPENEPFVAREAMQDISLRVILQAVFGLNEGNRYEQLRSQLTDVLEAMAGSSLRSFVMMLPFLQKDLGAWSPWGQFLRQRAAMDELIYAEIRERRQQPEQARGEDILSLLLSARDEAGEGMTDQELRDELMTLLMAGHETTATALAWALYWIHRTPEVRSQLLVELEEAGLSRDFDSTAADFTAIAKLPYLSAVCSETLRIYPVALFTFARITQTPVTLAGQTFPAGTMLMPCIYLMHRRPELYPDPDRFIPDRFLDRQYATHEFMAFGGSNRRCIGMAFALYEMKLVLATILLNQPLALAETRPVKPTRRGLTMTPTGGVKLRKTAIDEA
ncbi:MAG: cytochrome P450 [Cyanobacteria bacterium J06648_16]